MKLITFTVPCYNSQDYMRHCIDNLVTAGNEAEILIVDDGSTDSTPRIADRYAEKYPDIVKVIHQENGGHGDAVNTGLRNATGLYFQVVDSDDWLDVDALEVLMTKIRNSVKLEKVVDVFMANYVYEHTDGPGHTMKYDNVFRKNRIITWNETSPFKATQYLSMHSVIYRTKVLRACGLTLPKHTFYVDNLFVYIPLPYCRTIYYMDIDLYRYFVGRPDQSVNEENILKRVDQHYRVALKLIDSFDLPRVKAQSPALARVLVHHISMMVTITSVFLYMDGSTEKLAMNTNMWNKIKEKDPALYRSLKYRSVSALTTVPGKPGRKITVSGYKLAKRLFKFN